MQSTGGAIMVPPADDNKARSAALAALKLSLKGWTPKQAPHTLAPDDLAAASASIAKLRARTVREKIPDWATPLSAEPWQLLTIRKDGAISSSPTFYVYNFNTAQLSISDRPYDLSEYYPYDAAVMSAPNFLNAAYLEAKQRLHLFSNSTSRPDLIYEGDERTRLFLNTGSPAKAWSPDSKKILFSTAKFSGQYEEWGNEPVYETDYYRIFDISDGSFITFPANLGVTVEQFIDANRVLVDVFVNKRPDSYFITTILNLDTMQLDQDWFEEKLGYMETFIQKYLPHAGIVGRFFSLQNSKYVYNIREQAREGYTFLPPELFKEGRTIFIYGDFQDKTKSTVMASGKWEQYQNPLISPSGDKVAYEEVGSKKLVNQKQGQTIFWVYDVITGRHQPYKLEHDAHIIQWLDEDRLLFALSKLDSFNRYFISAFKILNTADNSIKNVWTASDSSDKAGT